MIKFSNNPWQTGALAKRSNTLFAVLAISVLLFSVIGLFMSSQANAQDTKAQKCENFVVVGDTHALGDKSAELEKKLKTQGAKSVEFIAHNGTKTSEIPSKLKGKKLDGKCIIVESGTAGTKQSKEKSLKDIKDVLASTGNSSKVYWVTPVVSDSKASKNWSTKTFNEALNEASKSNEKLSIINVQDMSLNDSYYADNGVSMSDSGYSTRVSSIIDSIEESNKSNSSNSSSSPSNNSDSSSPSSSNGSSGDGNGGSNSDTSQDSPPTTTAPTEPPEDPCATQDCFKGDPNAVSPKAMADNLDKMTSYGDASRYLAIQRWQTMNVPAVPITSMDPSALPAALSSQTTKAIMGFGNTLLQGVYYMIVFAFTPSIASAMTMVADGIFGNIMGGTIMDERTSNAGSTGTIISSLMTILILMSVIKAANTDVQMTVKQRVASAVSSILKGSLVIMLVLFIASQSRKNGQEMDSSLRDASQTVATQEESSGSMGADSTTANSNQNTSTTSAGGNDINNPKSWHALSLGWIVSMAYHYGQVAGGAITNIIRAMTITPIDSFTRTISDLKTGFVGKETQCDRYIDAMHYAFGNTAAVENNPDKSMVLMSLDNLFIDTFYEAYSYIYGGNTRSAGRTWCYQLEKDNGIRSPEWMMLSRTAGLYSEAIGVGNLIGNDSTIYSNGTHSNVSYQASMSPGLSPKGGYIVNQAGEWVSSKPEDNFPGRANIYMGNGGGDDGAAEARYYFSACTWNPGGNVHLDKDWEQVRGMGGTGGSDTTESDEYKPQDNSPANPEDDAEGAVVGSAQAQANATMSNVNNITSAEGYKSHYLSDIDCYHPQIFPIGSSDGSSKYGFGAKDSEPAKRWNFAPVNKNMVEEAKQKVKDIGSSVANTMTFGLAGKSGDEQEKDKKQEDPTAKFGSSMNAQGYMPAFQFWNWSNGYHSGVSQWIAFFSIVCLLVLFVLVAIAAIPAMAINLILSVLFIFIPAFMIISLLMMMIRGGVRK